MNVFRLLDKSCQIVLTLSSSFFENQNLNSEFDGVNCVNEVSRVTDRTFFFLSFFSQTNDGASRFTYVRTLSYISR
jgi:hypothetical protein